MEQLEALCEWVLKWGVLERRDFCKNIYLMRSKDIEKNPELDGVILLHEQDDFLRHTHGPLTAKLSLSLYAISEQLGMSITNAAAHVFSGCHLMNGLKVFAETSLTFRKKVPCTETNMIVAKTKLCSDRHKKEIFAGKLPTAEDPLHKIMSLCAGRSLQNSFPAAPGKKKELKRSQRTKTLMSNKFVILLQEYIHQKITFLEMLYKLEKEMQSTSSGTHSQKSLLETDFVQFLKSLKPMIEQAISWMEFDYLKFHCEWLDIFQRINAIIQRTGTSIKPFNSIKPPTETQWKTQTEAAGKWHSFVITEAILIEIECVLGEEKDMRRGKKPTHSIPTPLVDIALGVLEAHRSL
jgi:hypothetical protein